jgi:hypothetical protein
MVSLPNMPTTFTAILHRPGRHLLNHFVKPFYPAISSMLFVLYFFFEMIFSISGSMIFISSLHSNPPDAFQN